MGLMPELEYMYPEGSDITIMNTFYSRPKFSDGKKLADDFMVLVYKDNKDGQKHHKIIKNPNYTYYKLKDTEKQPAANESGLLFIERSKVDAINVPYDKLEADIAKRLGREEEYKFNIKNRDRYANKALHKDPRLFYSDANIEDHFRFKFANTYTNNLSKLYKGYFDIEVDGKWAKGDFVEPGECAVNCVSFFDDKTDTAYTFILRDEKNPLVAIFEEELNSGRYGWKEIHKFIVDAVGGEEQAKKYKVFDSKYNITFYDQEIDLISDLFKTIHSCNPDFVLGYNSSAFDIPYLLNRIINLGYNPLDIVCDKSWEIPIVENFVDSKNINNLAERGDYTFISGDTIFIDQMIQYASRRKAKIGSYKSFKLDDIGLKEAGVHKLDYSHLTHSVVELPYVDFKTFVLYNIMDVIVQKCIEEKCHDIEYIFAKCVTNNTVYRKGHRQTVYLVNRMAASWYKMGYIIGNNGNKDNEKPPKYLGALVGNPDNTNSYSKMSIDNRVIWVCENLVDYDFKALYPSIMREFNIAPNTQIGRIEIDHKIYNNENAYHIDEDKYSRGGEYIENLVTDNFIEFSHRWLKLANIVELIEDIDEFFGCCGFGKYSDLISKGYNNDGRGRTPILPTTKGAKSPIRVTNSKTRVPLYFYNNRNRDYTYYNLIEDNKKKGRQ